MTTTSSQSPSIYTSYSSSILWDVFLSFRGKDTRYRFTSHLYAALDRHGIRTFMDDPALCRGEVISSALLEAIQKSKIHIVVLSENYASSGWCLDELVEILNCYKTIGGLVIPVFYNIDTSVVRQQLGKFQEAFEKHQICFQGEMEKVNKWRLALKEVANLSGYHICENRSEADIINKIVERVLFEVNPKTLNVAKYPVGLDCRVKDIAALLNGGREGVIRIGIYGMGGMGKTTLAKALYKKLLLGNFKDSCFLANVREVSSTVEGLISLQQQLIDDVLKSKKIVKVHSVDQGIEIIRARICSTKVLVVIDDLDHLKPFESLVGQFASGSVVMITTRDEEILDKTEVESRYRYRVKILDDAESLTLFTQHAFGHAKPDDTLMVLFKDILRHAGGLPLALEVFGSYLYKRSEVGWKSFIEKLQRIPNSSIQQRLVISLDAIELDDPMLKKIFIDIACFFIGRRKREVVRILETYYSYSDHSIDILKKRCLITINNRDELGMHDLFRDIGREIARNNTPDEPGKHSRLWLSKDIWNVLKKHKGTEAIEGIIHININYQDELNGVSLATDTFKKMSKLRFLHLLHVNITGSFEHTLKDLRWLCWDRCPLDCFPSGFYPKKLVTLEMPHSQMRTIWELNTVSPVFKNLRTLNMSYSFYLSTTPEFSDLPCLETVNLKDCKRLEEVQISIGSFVRLVSLNLENCESLRSLHDNICNLRALKYLNISGCTSLKALPIKFGNIDSLKEFYAEGLTIKKLPDSIKYLSKLVFLTLSGNRKLENLPDTICDLRALELLNIGNCSSLEALPSELGSIKSLKELNAWGLTVSELPYSIGDLSELVKLRLSNNQNLETLPHTICDLKSLEILNIDRCKKLQELPDQLWKITSLRELDASGANLLKLLPNIEPNHIPSSLKELIFSKNDLTALPSGISQLSNLEGLDLRDCCHLLFIAELPPNLKWMYLDGCTTMERLPNLSNLKRLEILDLTSCSELEEILGLEELTSIIRLHVRGCNSSFLAHTFSESYFQVLSKFRHQITIYTPHIPDWIRKSSNVGSSVSLTLQPNVSHQFMALILCF